LDAEAQSLDVYDVLALSAQSMLHELLPENRKELPARRRAKAASRSAQVLECVISLGLVASCGV
jgi:hypothetical protein